MAGRALRELRALPADAQRRVGAAIGALANNPRPDGCKKLQARRPPEYRIRIGDYRVIYGIDDRAQTVTIDAVSQRGDVYR